MKQNMPVTDTEYVLNPDAMIVSKTDLKGVITYANAEFIAASGFGERELLGQPHNLVRHPDMPPAVFRELWDSLGAGRPWTGLVKNRRKNGDFYWVRANIAPLWENGRVTGYLSVRGAISKAEAERAAERYRRMNAGGGDGTPLWRRLNFLGRWPLRRLGILVGVLLLAAVAVPMGLLLKEIGAGIEFAEQERQGVVYLQALSALLDDLPRHRAFVAAALGGDASARAKAAEVEAKIEAELAVVDALDTRWGAAYATGPQWAALRGRWQALRQAWPMSKGADGSEAHNALLNSLLGLITQVSDASNLTLDPELATYYLMDGWVFKNPQSLYHLGLVRGLATAAALRQGISEADHTRLALLSESVRATQAANRSGLTKVFGELPGLRESLSPLLENSDRRQQAFLELLDRGIVQAGPVGLPPEEVSAAGGAAIEAGLQLHAGLGAALDGALAGRIDRFASRRAAMLAASLALALLAAGVQRYMMRRVLVPLGQASEGFMRIAQGDFTQGIEVAHNDECGEVLNVLRCVQTKLGYDMVELRRLASEGLRIKAALDNASTGMMVSDQNFDVAYLNPAARNLFKAAEADLRGAIPGFDADRLLGTGLDLLQSSPARSRHLLEQLMSTYRFETEVAGRCFVAVVNPVFDHDGQRIGSVVEWADRTAEVAIERQVNQLLEEFRSGDLARRIEAGEGVGFLKTLCEGLNQVASDTELLFKDFGWVIRGMAEGDLTRQTGYDAYTGIYGEFRANLARTQDRLGGAFGQIRRSAEFIHNASQEIATGNNDLSQRAEQQAASLQQTSASMEELTGTVRENAEHALRANEAAAQVRLLAERGGEVVRQAVAAMAEINESSAKIARIIGTIDMLASQTNLLALNAAVEAARAGEQGKGFAVVAAEVRGLAQRSAQAAKESRELIEGSLDKVRVGVGWVSQSGGMLEEIVAGVRQVGGLVSQISAASAQQAQDIGQVNQAVAQMDEITQQNAALAEETSAASLSMCGQAEEMVRLVGFFKTGDGAGGSLAAPSPDRPARRSSQEAVSATDGGGWGEF
ncbi:methyl-accepting chemotaxis protein [Methylomagnum ishizawai]|uniref:methyl-accepting chemotaxis protein n=1 Tax=Methylomagnum ishizawai TaxID=1760988 RepID=UPI001C326FAE|nr:methyl-accepting chemotaxis protein [Methylomagnum ishizawai]BBL75757.1 hypothetical protein MishRS11D_28550 [Methylomagnum ishizawai]